MDATASVGPRTPFGARAAPAPGPAREPSATSGDAHEPGRSGFTAALTGVAVLGGAAKSVLLDRARCLIAFPHARAQGKTGKWAAELLTAKLTNDIVPIEGGTIRAFGRTITTNGWKFSYQLTNAVSLGLLGAGLMYGIPNLVEGWQDGGGPAGLMETRHGRTGVLGTTGTVFQLGVMTAAAASVPSGTNRVAGMLKSPLMSSGPIILAGIALGIPVAVNELGFLDVLDAGNDDSFLENAEKTIDRHVGTIRDRLGLD